MKLIKGILGVVFPEICVCCSNQLSAGELHLCSFCMNDRFENTDEGEGLVLPETVLFRTALWTFDKGGILQDLLHVLKYDFLSGLGIDFGAELGRYLKAISGRYPVTENNRWILVPVPLHRKRLRQRGYNQARAIARGVQKVTGWYVADPGIVCRIRDTRTQTGLTRGQRRNNMHSAFRIEEKGYFKNTIPVIIDDVFTTGSTTYELAGMLVSDGACKAGIATIAEA